MKGFASVGLAIFLANGILGGSEKYPSAFPGGGDIEITPLIHASVQIEYGGKVIQVDPWSAGDLSQARPADIILITDNPVHHLDLKAIQQLRKAGTTVVIPAVGKPQLPDGVVLANGASTVAAGVRIEAIPAYDIKPGAPEHPKGKSNGYVVTIGGRRLYFSGVTECVPEVQALKNIDVAFLPMNIPVERMMPAATAACARILNPKLVYVYHYDQDFAAKVANPSARTQGVPGGLTVAQSLDAFRDAIKGSGIEFQRAKWYPHEPDPARDDINTVSEQCPSSAELKAIDHDLKLLFDSDPTHGTRACSAAEGSRDLTVMQSRVYRSLSVMRRLQFTEPLPWTRDSVYHWLTRSVRGVRFRADAGTSSCCGPDGLINVRSVVETSQDGRQSGFALALTRTSGMDTDFRLLATFMQLLVHEARHNNGKPHTCGTKDQTIREMGAWGSAYTFQQWIAEKTQPGFVPISVKLSLQRATEQICKFQICAETCGGQ